MSKDSLNVGQFGQLPLFMTGVEWQDSVTHSTDGPAAQAYAERLEQSKGNTGRGAGLYESMQKHGYQRDLGDKDVPTIVLEDSPSGKSIRQVQSEGHHRVAVAADIERKTGKPVYIPTNYVDNTSAARNRRVKK
jgi:hypothetical protein